MTRTHRKASPRCRQRPGLGACSPRGAPHGPRPAHQAAPCLPRAAAEPRDGLWSACQQIPALCRGRWSARQWTQRQRATRRARRVGCLLPLVSSGWRRAQGETIARGPASHLGRRPAPQGAWPPQGPALLARGCRHGTGTRGPDRSLPRCRHVLVQELGHLKHGDLVASQDLFQGGIRMNLASILRVLELVGLNV